LIKSLVQLCGCVVLGPSIGPSTRTTIPVIDVSRRETALARAHTHTDTHITFCRLTLISRQRSPKSPEPGSGMKDRPRRGGSPPARSNVRTCERQRERKGRRRRKGRRELGGVHYGRAAVSPAVVHCWSQLPPRSRPAVKLRATAARFSPGVFDNSIGACPGSQPQHAASSVPQKVARLVSLGAFPISLHWPPLDRRAVWASGPFPKAVGFPPEGNLPRVP
jgi:hypothetical protein